MQGPHGGSCLINDLSKTSFQQTIALHLIEHGIKGNKDAAMDLAYAKRREWYADYKATLGEGTNSRPPVWVTGSTGTLRGA
jgi:hypothetical protein